MVAFEGPNERFGHGGEAVRDAIACTFITWSSEKSSWPGVSSRLKTRPSFSKVITDVATEMPRSCSIFIQSDRVRRRLPLARQPA
jgi:hypothetical protein